MGDAVRLTVDGHEVEVPAGASVMDACDLAGVYVPRLCAYPGLDPVGDCGLCFVRLSAEGFPAEARRACSVTALPGMVVETRDEQVAGFRLSSMKAILGDHPHVCLTCPQREGCSRDECMYGNPPEARCCGELGRCEIARVAAYVGALEAAPQYRFRALGISVDHSIRRDLDLCVGCGRCVAACDNLEEAGSALELVETRALVCIMGGGAPVGPSPGWAVDRVGDEPASVEAGAADQGSEWQPQSYLGRHVAVPKASDGDLRASGCTFCGACVVVCPSGALTAYGARGAAWLAKRRERSTLRRPVLPPEDRPAFAAEEVALAPSKEGVFVLYSATGDVLQISGVLDLKASLTEALEGSLGADVAAFTFEEEFMYTQRESELLAHHLQTHGSMPRGNDPLGGLCVDDDDQLL